MKRFALILCALSLLLALSGCGGLREVGAAEGTEYALSWGTQPDTSILLTFDAAVPEGYVWSGSSNGIVELKGPVSTKKGIEFKVKAKKNGPEQLKFELRSEAEDLCIYLFKVSITVENNGQPVVKDCSGSVWDTVTQLGEGKYAMTCVSNPEELRLLLPGSDWEMTLDNPVLRVEQSLDMDGTKISIRKQDMNTYQTAIYEEYSEKKITAKMLEKKKALYDEVQEDQLTLSSCTAAATYHIDLQTGLTGTVTVTALAQGAYEGKAAHEDIQIYYDEITGETHVQADRYTGWLPEEEREPNTAEVTADSDAEFFKEKTDTDRDINETAQEDKS